MEKKKDLMPIFKCRQYTNKRLRLMLDRLARHQGKYELALKGDEKFAGRGKNQEWTFIFGVPIMLAAFPDIFSEGGMYGAVYNRQPRIVMNSVSFLDFLGINRVFYCRLFTQGYYAADSCPHWRDTGLKPPSYSSNPLVKNMDFEGFSFRIKEIIRDIKGGALR